jgi:hypothetical protein
MGLFQNHMMAAAASVPGVAYTIDNSCLFNIDDTAYLARDVATTLSNKFTYSFWVKRLTFGTYQYIVTWRDGTGAGSPYGMIQFNNDDTISPFEYDTASSSNYAVYTVTDATFRDPSIWYHIVVNFDYTRATSDRVRVYVNGTLQTFGTNENSASAGTPQSQATGSDGNFLGVAKLYNASTQRGDFYMAEVHLVSDAALAASAFGKTNTDGDWVPIEYTGSYGDEGHFLDFESSGDLGNDVSGNNNDFTSSGLAAADQVTDTPTSNKSVLNPRTDTGVGHLSAATISDGGLVITMTASSLSTRAPATLKVSSGKWYWEAKYTGNASGQGYGHIGIWDSGTALPTYTVGGGVAGANEWIFGDGGLKNHDNTSSDTGLGNWAVNNIIQVCIDLDADKIWFGFQNTFQGDPAAGSGESFSSIGDDIVPVIYGYGGGSGQGNWGPINFGQRDFAYTPPTGFEAIASDNSQDVTVSTAPTPT